MLVVDDVITAGTAIRESVALIQAAGAQPCGVVIALDRQERGQSELSAADEVRRSLGLPVVAVAGLADLLALARERPDWADRGQALAAYQSRWGTPTQL